MIGVGLFLLCGALLVLTASMIVASFPLRSRAQNGLAFGVVCYGQIVLLTQILSEMRSIWWPGYLVGQFVMLGAAFLVWVLRGYPTLIPRWRVVRSARARPLLALLIAISGGLAIYSLVLALAFPAITADASVYHLPRAYFWLQHGTARHFPAGNFRMNEFPPNASYVYAWIMSVSRHNYLLLVIAPWLAGGVAALGTFALARTVGSNRHGAVAAGVLFLTMPQPIVQMATKQNDAHTAAMTVAFLVFALAGLRGSRTATACAGVAFGLMLGTKFTVFFLLPGLAVMLVVVAVVPTVGEPRPRPYTTRSVASALVVAFRRLAPLAFSCLVGFALFGAYNYVLTAINVGNPITSSDMDGSSSAFDPERAPHFYNTQANLARYAYQTMDWAPYAVGNGHVSTVFMAHQIGFAWLDRTLNLNVAGDGIFPYALGNPAKPSDNVLGYGPVGYALVLVAMPLGVVLVPRAMWLRRRGEHTAQGQDAFLSSMLLLAGWSWLLLFALIVPYSPWRPRYFIVFMPLLLAGGIPLLANRRGWSILVLCVGIGLIYQYATTTHMLARPGRVAVALDGGRNIGEWPGDTFVTDEVLAITPHNGTVAFVEGPYLLFHQIPHLPDRHLILLDRQNISEVLESREVQAAVVYGGLCNSERLDRYIHQLDHPNFCLMVPPGYFDMPEE